MKKDLSRKVVDRIVFLLTIIATLFHSQTPTAAAPPEVHTQPFLQSPVRAEPDDLLMIPGHGFAGDDIVVYQRLVDTTQALVPPTAVPQDPTAAEGVAAIVHYKPEALMVRLPFMLVRGQSYALWVRNPNGEWSKGIRINDARPLWFTPDISFRKTSLASLPRELKVIGRNLNPSPGQKTQVKLVGPKTYIRTAANDHDPSTAIEHHVARIELPKKMLVGEYRVEVSRDGTSWVAVAKAAVHCTARSPTTGTVRREELRLPTK